MARGPGRSIRHRRCLVVSGDVPLRRRIDAAAAACGWMCIAPADAATLATAGIDHAVVFLDVVRPPRGAGSATAGLAATFAAGPDTRLVVCGAPDRPDEERWARQLGACVYLPGVAVGPGLTALVKALCR